MYILRIDSMECSEYSNTPDIFHTVKLVLNFEPAKEQMVKIVHLYANNPYLGIESKLKQAVLYHASFCSDGILHEGSEIIRLNTL